MMTTSALTTSTITTNNIKTIASTVTTTNTRTLKRSAPAKIDDQDSIWNCNTWTTDTWTGVDDSPATASPSWVEFAAGYCAATLQRVTDLLKAVAGEKSVAQAVALQHDVACQTDVEVGPVLTVSPGWQQSYADHTSDEDEDTASIATETTETSTDMEEAFDFVDHFEGPDGTNDAGDLRISSYLCKCDVCKNNTSIKECVAVVTMSSSVQERKSVERILQAFATYNEVIIFHASMVPAALECVQTCHSDDEAFEKFIDLYDQDSS